MFLDHAIYKSYFFSLLYHNLSNISGFKFWEYIDLALRDCFSILVQYVVHDSADLLFTNDSWSREPIEQGINSTETV